MRVTHILALVGTLVLTGCSSMMKPADNQVIEASPKDSTQVVFMRSAFMAKAIDASVYDVTGGKTQFIGILANGTKVAYPTTPGHHTFMVVSEAADFLEADLAPGKTYYSMVIPRMGMWKALLAVAGRS